MKNEIIQFLSFDKAVAAAKNEPDVQFIGLHYVAPFTRLDVYVIDVDSEEPDDVRIQFEGGELFDSGGEEEFYDLTDVPDEAKALYFARQSDLGKGNAQIMGMVSEYVLQEVLPGLSEKATFKSQAEFIQLARAEYLSFWKPS